MGKREYKLSENKDIRDTILGTPIDFGLYKKPKLLILSKKDVMIYKMPCMILQRQTGQDEFHEGIRTGEYEITHTTRS